MSETVRPSESLPDNFGVDFNCDIGALYGRLTEKQSKTLYYLSSNWGDISDVDIYSSSRNCYDIFGHITMFLRSSLKMLSVPEIKDRNSKLITATAILWGAEQFPFENRVAEIISESARLGIGLSFVEPDPNSKYQKGWLVPQNPELKWAIGFETIMPKSGSFSTHAEIVYPFRERLDLEGHQTLQNILQNMSSAIEHTVRVFYAVEGKILPEKRLNFFPYVEPEKAKDMLAFTTCSYCGSDYSKLAIKCPSCGARAPLSH